MRFSARRLMWSTSCEHVAVSAGDAQLLRDVLDIGEPARVQRVCTWQAVECASTEVAFVCLSIG